MAVMRHLTVDGTTYDTVGEASVTQVVSSGTKVATVTIDGTATDLYAPTPPTASTTAPSMDGTASYGSGTSYARSNHVHPTDTSRQAALVSGTNIKTINGNSLLGSGDLVISGGGGVSYSTTTATLPTSGWSNNSITVNVTGVTASNDVIVAPAPASAAAWAAAGIVCTAQGAGTLTFTRTSANTAALTANVMVFEGGVVLHNITNSTVYTVDKSTAAAGETVTISTLGAASYQVTVYKTGSSSTVVMQPTLSLPATFTMPDYDVTVAKYTAPK